MTLSGCRKCRKLQMAEISMNAGRDARTIRIIVAAGIYFRPIGSIKCRKCQKKDIKKNVFALYLGEEG